MALKNLSIPSASGDLVAIIGEEFGQVFTLARPMKNVVGIVKNVMKHPVEDGSEIIDHQVLQPVEIELPVFIGGEDPRSIFQQLKQSYTRGELFTIQGKTETYQSMLMTALPYEESVEMFGATVVILKFEEVKFVRAQYGSLPARKVANPANADTLQRGNQQPEPVQRPSLLKGASDSVRNFYKNGRENVTNSP